MKKTVVNIERTTKNKLKRWTSSSPAFGPTLDIHVFVGTPNIVLVAGEEAVPFELLLVIDNTEFQL